MSIFDPETFIQQTYDQKGSTDSIPPPKGEYGAIGSRLAPRQFSTKDGQLRTVLDLSFELDDPNGDLKRVTGRDKNYARYTIWLDLTAEGALDMAPGMNVQLNRLREELGQNEDGKQWKMTDLLQIPVKVVVDHSDPDPNGRIFANVVAVSKF